MERRPLFHANLNVSVLSLGTMTWGEQNTEAEAHAQLDYAIAQGVNFIDTADVYTKGASEEMVGKLIQPHRHDWVLATKLGNRMSERVNEGHYSRSWMLREVDASLQRLQTSHIDILYLHLDIDGLDAPEVLHALADLVRAGKIRYWALSNFRGWRIAEAVHLAQRLGVPPPVVCQPYYNLLNRMPEVEILPACRQFGVGVVPYSPIARGVLSGKYAPGQKPPEGTRAGRNDTRIMQTEFRAESLDIAARLKTHCEATGRTLPHFATAWVLAHRAVSSVIAGPRTASGGMIAFTREPSGRRASTIGEASSTRRPMREMILSMMRRRCASSRNFASVSVILPLRST